MTKHQKRLSVPNSWPVERKTDTFTVKADAGPHGEAGVPLLIVLRDVLGYVDNRKEARYALDQDSVLVNGKPVSDEERPIGMFDILAFEGRGEHYRVFPGQGGRLSLTPIDADAAGSKLGKIVNKQHVPGGDVQLTLHDGQTLVVDEGSDYDGGDSLVVGNEDREASGDASDASGDEPRAGEVVAHFEYEAGALVTAVDGEHAGEIGTIDEIQVTPGSADNLVVVEQDGGDGFETVEEYVVVIDENFTEDDGDGAADSDEDDEGASDEDDEAPSADEEAADEEAADESDEEDRMDEAAEELDEQDDEAAEELVDEGGDDE